MQTAPLGLAASSVRSPLLGAYALWSNAEFAACIAEVRRIEDELGGEFVAEAAVLSARAYLRLELAEDALGKLNQVRSISDVDVRCTVEALRGSAEFIAGRHSRGMDAVRRAITLCDEAEACFPVRMEAVYQQAFGLWKMGAFDEAEVAAQSVAMAKVDILSARAVALLGWIEVGRLNYARSVSLFHDAWRMCRSCAGRDVAFEASLIHAVATYELLLLTSGSSPRYYAGDFPGANKAVDTYRLLVGSVDSWRAVLAGDQARALEYAAATELADVEDHWRVFGMTSHAGVLEALGYLAPSRALASATFAAAMSLEWRGSPAESCFALLYLAERFAPYDLDRARRCLATFSRAGGRHESRPFGEPHPFHRAIERHARGVVAAAAGDDSAASSFERAAELFDEMGFRWRAAATRLQLVRLSRQHNGPIYRSARAFIDRSFPDSHLRHDVGGLVHRRAIEGDERLSSGHVAIVRALCAGRTPCEIATDRGTSIGTVRNQLKEIYRRTGLRSVQAITTTFLSDGGTHGRS